MRVPGRSGRQTLVRSFPLLFSHGRRRDDKHLHYQASPVDDPQGPPQSSARVVRGGSWNDYPRYCRAAYRRGIAPSHRFNVLGFRVAAVPLGR